MAVATASVRHAVLGRSKWHAISRSIVFATKVSTMESTASFVAQKCERWERSQKRPRRLTPEAGKGRLASLLRSILGSGPLSAQRRILPVLFA